MPTLGITGGIATGKSSFTTLLSARMPSAVFDADAAVRDLLDHDADVKQRVKLAFGEEAYMDSGEANRKFLRARIFSSPEKKRELEGILHPPVRRQWMALASEKRRPGEWLLADIPLLYETGAELHLDRVAVVACDGATQRQRLSNNRKLGAATAEKIIAAQMDIGIKISRADHVVWNGGSKNSLAEQARLLADFLG